MVMYIYIYMPFDIVKVKAYLAKSHRVDLSKCLEDLSKQGWI